MITKRFLGFTKTLTLFALFIGASAEVSAASRYKSFVYPNLAKFETVLDSINKKPRCGVYAFQERRYPISAGDRLRIQGQSEFTEGQPNPDYVVYIDVTRVTEQSERVYVLKSLGYHYSQIIEGRIAGYHGDLPANYTETDSFFNQASNPARWENRALDPTPVALTRRLGAPVTIKLPLKRKIFSDMETRSSPCGDAQKQTVYGLVTNPNGLHYTFVRETQAQITLDVGSPNEVRMNFSPGLNLCSGVRNSTDKSKYRNESHSCVFQIYK